MSHEIHLHLQLRHLLALLAVLMLAPIGTAAAFAANSDSPLASVLRETFRPAGTIRIARSFSLTPISCGYFATCAPAAKVNFTVPDGRLADLVVTFTGTADTTGACNVHALLDGSGFAFESDPYVFVLHDTVGGHTNTVHWTLNDVPAGKHNVSVRYFESVSTVGHCSFDSRYLTVLASLH